MTVDMNNGMISVKDQEVMEKRYAFQKTIELHKKMQDMRPNAVFQSKNERTIVPAGKSDYVGKSNKHSSSLDVADTNYQTIKSSNFKSNKWLNESIHNPLETGKESIRAGQDKGYTIRNQGA